MAYLNKDIASGTYNYGRRSTGKYFITGDGRIVTVDRDNYSRNISVDEANREGYLRDAGFKVDSKGRYYRRDENGKMHVYRSTGNQLVEIPHIKEFDGMLVDTSNYTLGTDGHYYRRVSPE